MSVLENAKSNRHRKAHDVEPDDTDRKFMHLTRGDLPRESAREVSRGRSSKEARRKASGAKGRRTRESSQPLDFTVRGAQDSETAGARQLRQLPPKANARRPAGLRGEERERRTSREPERKEAAEGA
jgi:hypothetical protein